MVRANDEKHFEYLGSLNKILDELILNTDMYTSEIMEEVEKRNLIINKHYIALRIKEIEPIRKSRILSKRRMDENNPVFKEGVIEKIRKTIKDRWIQGCYKDRINGMLEITKEKHPNYKQEIHKNSEQAKRFYSDFLSKFEDITTCRRCGSKENINIHHIDEDHENFLISDLEPLCVPCHMIFHYSVKKLPFVTISKKLSFASAHFLPQYTGLCENFHGHEWGIEVSVKKRIDPATMMVMDFKDLSGAIKKYIIEVFDHNVLNDIIAIPTAENLLVWCWEELMFKASLKGIEEIKIWESPDSAAKITRSDMLSIFSKKIDKEL
jgi:6-pyruvoyltetrahydropterin/6-carboxytetrahydropterin synthase